MPSLADPVQTAERLRAAGLIPTEPLPPPFHEQWTVTCAGCAAEVTVAAGKHRKGSGCRKCTDQATGQARRLDPETAAAECRSVGFDPAEPYPGSALDPWKVTCRACGAAAVKTLRRLREGKRCRACFHRDRARRRLAAHAAAAEAVMRDAGLEPQEPYPGSDKPWLCRCTACDFVKPIRHSDVRKGHAGCSACAVSGFNPAAPAVVYLLTDPRRGAHKIGVTAADSTRLALHRRRGWTVLHTVAVPTGAHALEVERAVLRWLREDRGLPAALDGEDGATETVDAATVSARTIWARVEQEVASLPPDRADLDAYVRRRDPSRWPRALSSETAEQKLREHGMTPLEPYPGRVTDPWRARCDTCRTEGAPMLANLRDGKGGCVPCGARESARKRSLSAEVAMDRLTAAGWVPQEAYPGRSTDRWRIACARCGHPRHVSVHVVGLRPRCRACPAVPAVLLPRVVAGDEEPLAA